MNYTIEARVNKQAKYGAYCNYCRILEQEIIPYHSFTLDIYAKTKKLIEEKNKNDKL